MTPHEDIVSLLGPTGTKPINILVIDHDVTRYHSLDLLRHMLYRDSRIGNVEHFSSLKPEYGFLVSGKPYDDIVNDARINIGEFNVLNCFSRETPASMGEYAKALESCMIANDSKITETDMNSDFGNLFRHREISGSLLRYRSDRHVPPWAGGVTVYEETNILDPAIATSIIARRRVGVVLLSSTAMALDVAEMMRIYDIDIPVTFIIARYGYNFTRSDGSLSYPMFGDEMNRETREYHHDFGFFNPFGKRKGG